MKNRLVLKDDSTFEEAVRLLDENGNGFLPVIDTENKLVGILTDGDIRRAILNKKNKLADIINRNPVTLKHTVSKKQAILFLKSIHRRHLPLVDEENRLVDIIVLDDLEFNAKPNKVVIMAGGLGTRLGELTNDLPKPMLTVGKRPLLENIIVHCYEHGLTNIYISVNYKSSVIKDYFKDGSSFGVNIKYIEEKEKLGTAGALSLIEDEFEDPFIVINGDILTTLDLDNLLRYHIDAKSDATMCIKEIEYQVAYGVVNINGTDIVSIKEKPSQKIFINAGIYVFNPGIRRLIPKDRYFDMTSFFELLIKEGFNVQSYIMSDYWIDIGQIKDIETAKNDFKVPGEGV